MLQIARVSQAVKTLVKLSVA